MEERKPPPAPASNRDWCPTSSTSRSCTALAAVRPHGPKLNYARSSRAWTCAVKSDLRALMTDSQEWWPADSPLWTVVHSHGLAQRRHLPSSPMAAAAQVSASSASRPQQLAD